MTPKELTKAKIDLYGELVRAPRVSAGVLGVAWLLLFKYLNAESVDAWPSAQTLADDLGGSERAVRYARNWLVDEGWFSTKRSRGRHSNRYSPNFGTMQPTARLTMQPIAGLTRQNDVSNPAKTRISTRQAVATYTLEESKEETLAGAHAREASPNGFARGAPLKTKKLGSAELEDAIYQRRQELAGSVRFPLTDRERRAADEWLREHDKKPNGETEIKASVGEQPFGFEERSKGSARPGLGP